MPSKLKIDFVSDVACPWCAVGLGALEQAVRKLDSEVQVELHFQPFELNPQMPPEGQDVGEHLTQKYGSTAAQQAALWQQLCERAGAVGFAFRREGRGRVWNTFDSHRLLHWAGEQGPAAQLALKRELLNSYFGDDRKTSDLEVLADTAARAGLDRAQALLVLNSDRYHKEVRERQAFYAAQGIRAVPSVIVNDRHLIQGGQPPEVFEQALRQIALDG